MTDLRPDIDDIRRAAADMQGVLNRTPLVRSVALGDELGAEIWLKLENLQVTGSFKARGAMIRLAALSEEERSRGVIAMSAGNHAQGVAFHAGRMGIPATIVMPRHTPFTKVARTEAHGATVELVGDDVAEAADAAARIAEETGATFIHPFDDPQVIAGQGTVGLEMLEDCPDLDDIIVPIGGGGLIAGIAIAAAALRPETRVYGVQSDAYPFMQQALGRGQGTNARTEVGVAEGIAVKRPGALTQRIVGDLVPEIGLVSDNDIERAIQRLAEQEKIVAEGAGAAGVAAMLARPDGWRGRKVGIVICGGNIDSRLLSTILLRGLARDGRMARLRITLPDKPGALASISALIGEAGANIVEIVHQRLFYDLPVRYAEVDVALETRNRRHVDKLIQILESRGFPARLAGGSDSAD
ncbi:MAG: threonine ammonia-lyase [Rhodospirillales bacterium]